ncbi:hypothetical protein DMA11_02985 [Marinilabiliaceae bacterium JC017]|nr:hypothetical protein DMA11_02985 [Marinilabiliaceae bacterium JC017]
MTKISISIPYADFQEYTDTIIQYLTEDLTKFTAFDPALNETTKTTLVSLHNTSLNSGSDRAEMARISEMTIEINLLMNRSKEIFTHIRYFVLKLYKNRPDIQKEFGLNTFRNVMRSQSKLIPFMYELAKVIEKYRTQLVEAGLSEEIANDVRPTAETLNATNTEQETRKNARKVSTVDRSEIRAQIYDILVKFNEAAGIVFANDPIRRQRYQFPYNNNKKNNDNNTTIDEDDQTIEEQMSQN